MEVFYVPKEVSQFVKKSLFEFHILKANPYRVVYIFKVSTKE